MMDRGPSLLDFLQAAAAQPGVKRLARLVLAGLAAGAALGYFLVQGLVSSNGIGLLLVALGLLAWGLRTHGGAVILPHLPAGEEAAVAGRAPAQVSVLPVSSARAVPLLRPLLAVVFALLAQSILDFRPGGYERSPLPGAVLYAIALGFLIWGLLSGDLVLTAPRSPSVTAAKGSLSLLSVVFAWGGVGFALAAFVAFDGDLFTARNVVLWALALVCWMIALTPEPSERLLGLSRPIRSRWESLRNLVRRAGGGLHLSGWSLLVLTVFLGVAFFRFYRLDLVAPEMTSDHAEKLLDVMDILSGKYPVYFPRNTGREFLEFYLAAFVATSFGTGISFVTLKIVTAAAGVATLPYVYLLGKELFDRRVGLLALVFAGIAYWPNVISRIGLRFPFYPLLAAPAMYYLIRGLRHRRSLDFLWAGLALGLGLNGYSPTRVLVFVMAMAVVVFVLHRESKGSRACALGGLAAALILSLVLALPLLRYAFDNPDLFWGRTLTRLGQEEQLYPGNPILIFLGNEINSLLMFSWNNGGAWILGIPGRPALDVVTAVLFNLGAVFLVTRYLKHRNWADLLVLLAIPMLLLPSTLSLAFPVENPALNRSSGAVPFVFLLPALGMVVLLDSLRRRVSGRSFAWWAGLILAGALAASTAQNYELTFVRYVGQYQHAAQNASEIGALVHDFAHSVGTYAEAFVVPYPYWVDTRLVGMYAGDPARDYAMRREALAVYDPGGVPLLVVVHRDDSETLALLEQRFPQGSLQRYTSRIPDHDFLFYFVPGSPVRQPQ